jgi:indolepyruvate ferredoxin oxidoreductase beta subunit
MAINKDRPITLLVCALGGEGGGVLAEWLVDTAIAAGHSVQSTSIPGVAQRTGATTYYIEVFPRPDSELAGRKPVFSLSPVPGELDLLISSELLETARQIGNGMSDLRRTQVISSSSRTLTTAEKMQLGDGRTRSEVLMEVLRAQSQSAWLLDMQALAQQSGTVISAVLMGAISGSGVLPFAPDAYRATIRAGGRGAEASLRGFDAAHAALQALRVERQAVQNAVTAALAKAAAPAATSPVPAWLQALPEPARALAALGHARVLEYQDSRYAGLYVQRLERVFAAERAGDPQGTHAHAATAEAARHLALWMAFDDIVRVAELKCRASREARVRTEVRAGPADLLRVQDHFKPGLPELAAMLPPGMASALLRWERRRMANGKPALSLPIRLRSHTVLGLVALRTLAACKWLRPVGSRYAEEQALIERWLAAIEHGARTHPALGREIAACGRLIKGYGATHDRGRDNLLHVIDHLAVQAPFDAPETRAAAIAAAREAALADDTGKALDLTLLRHGAAPRPVREQPIRWVRQRPGGRAGGSAT